MARPIPPYLINNQIYGQDPSGLNALDLYMSGKSSQVVPDEQVKSSTPPQATPDAAGLSNYMQQSSGAPSQLDMMRAYILSQKPTVSPEMERQMKIAEQNATDAMLAQKQAVADQKAQLADYASQPQGIDWRPLAAWADSFGGAGKTLEVANAMAPESKEAKAAKLMALRAGISQAMSGLSKDQLAAMEQKLKQQSYIENRSSKQDIAKMADLTKLATAGQTGGIQGQRLDLMKQRLGLQTGKEARSTVNNDPILKQFVPRLEGAAKIGELINSARSGGVVKNQALLGQLNAEIARLETGSQSPGLHASEKTELNSARSRLQSFADSITGNPTDSVSPAIFDAAEKLVNELSGSYQKGIDSRMEFLKSGMAPDQQGIVEAKHKSLKESYAPRMGGWDVESGKPKSIKQGGHEYILNEQTGQYE